MKVLCIHAHFDDFEFVAAGTFELWRRQLGDSLRARVIVCTDGKAGHHKLTRDETGKVRLQEQQASAEIGGYEFEQLKLADGTTPREACMDLSVPLLAGLWKSIRAFEPDYLFCPPIPTDPLAGIHIDHVVVAEAVRRVAYMINVPHAFTPEYPADETIPQPCKVPVIMNVHDGYMAEANTYDFAVDVEDAFQRVCELTWCHQSQLREWLPWVGRHDMQTPATLADWSRILRKRFEKRNHELNVSSSQALEFFTVTGWGSVPVRRQLYDDFPNIIPNPARLSRLR